MFRPICLIVAGPSRLPLAARCLHSTTGRAIRSSNGTQKAAITPINSSLRKSSTFSSTSPLTKQLKRPNAPQAQTRHIEESVAQIYNPPPSSRTPRSPSHLPRSPKATDTGSSIPKTEHPLAVIKDLPDWPWRPMKSVAPNVVAEERIIFTRPFENGRNTSPSGLPFWGLLLTLCTGLVGHVLYRRYTDPDRVIPGGPMAWIDGYLPYIGPLAVAVYSSILLSVGSLQLGTIVRLSQVRLRATPTDGGNEKITSFIRMVHGGHAIGWGGIPSTRDIPLGAGRLYTSRSLERQEIYIGVVRFQIAMPSMFPRWNRNYTLHFKETELLTNTKDEVVLSQRRLEHVLGRIREAPSTPPGRMVRFDRWLTQKLALDKIPTKQKLKRR